MIELADKDVELSDLVLSLTSDEASRSVLDRFLDRYVHQVRNRLNTIRLGLYIARRCPGSRPESLNELDTSYRELEQYVEQFQRLTRPVELSPIIGSFDRFIAERVRIWRKTLSIDSEAIQFESSGQGVPRSFDPNRLGQALDEFVARRVRDLPEGGTLLVSLSESRLWIESRPGLDHSPDFEQDLEDRESRSSDMSLAWLGRIVRAHGGVLLTRVGQAKYWGIDWPDT
jgi:signal transduction histidine kinase